MLKNMLAREQNYNAQEALERIRNDSGDEEDFDIDQNKVELYELASEDESGESEDVSGTGLKMCLAQGLTWGLAVKGLTELKANKHLRLLIH